MQDGGSLKPCSVARVVVMLCAMCIFVQSKKSALCTICDLSWSLKPSGSVVAVCKVGTQNVLPPFQQKKFEC